MGIDYNFFPRKALGQEIFSTECQSFEGYQIHEIEHLVEIFCLPKLPYYSCSETLMYTPRSERLDLRILDLPNVHFVLENSMSMWTNHEFERYQAYLEWVKWGLKRIDEINAKDVGKSTIPDLYKKSYIEDLEFIKENIRKLLELYKNHWYRFTNV